MLLNLIRHPKEGPTWAQADRRLDIPWKSLGGDWIDADGAQQGAKPWAVSTITTDIRFAEGLAPLIERLRQENTGIMVRRLAGDAELYSSESRPITLRVTTVDGVVDCPLLADVWVGAPSSTPKLGPTLLLPCLLKFDLSPLDGKGAIGSAEILVGFRGLYGTTKLGLFLLDMPSITTDPEIDIGGVIPRDPGTVPLTYDDLVSDDYVRQNYLTNPIASGGAEYRKDSRYGFTWCDIYASPTTLTCAAWWKLIQPKDAVPAALNGAPWRRAYDANAALGYDDLHLGMMVEIGEDLYDAYNEDGMKFPVGLQGKYDMSTSGAVTKPPPPPDGTWEGRLWITGKSVAHPQIYRPGIYFYGHAWPLSTHDGQGGGARMFNRQPYFCFRAGRPYWIEYRAKLNTPKQPDGIFEVWANGVLVHAEYSVDIRGYAAAQIQCIFLNLYHGGRTNLPLSRFHVSIAAVTLAERYIGPPVPLSAEPPPVTPPVEPPMVDQLDFTLPCALVEDAAGDILVSGRRFRATLKTATPVPPPVVDPPPVVVPPVVTPPVESPAPPPGPSALAQLAASMPPGTWSPLLNQDIDLVLGSGNIGTSNNLIPYCNSMPYDALTKRIHVVSGDHGKFQAWYMTYDLAANRWSKVAALNPLDTGSTHGWDHTAVNPHTGEMYYRRTTSNLIRRFRNGALEDFSGPLAENLSQITAQGATWWDAGLSGAGAQGAFVLYVANVPHNLHIYDPLADAWTIIRDVAPEAPVGVYDNVIEYSPTHNCAVFGGGGNFGGQHSRRLYRLNADRSISKLPDAPIPIGTSEGNFVCEPRSGNFLLFGSGQFWMLDPRGAGSWTDLTTRLPPMAKPPAGMLDPATGNSVISSAIWDLGVVVYVACLSRTCGMWVYRHA